MNVGEQETQFNN